MKNMPKWLTEAITPRPEDSPDLRWAVETVATMWERGDRRKTLLWLKQAAETARGDGIDVRADALAHAATEFERLGFNETMMSTVGPGGLGSGPGGAPPVVRDSRPMEAVSARPVTAPGGAAARPMTPQSGAAAGPMQSGAMARPMTPQSGAVPSIQNLAKTTPYSVPGPPPTRPGSPNADLLRSTRPYDTNAHPAAHPEARPHPPEIGPPESTVVMGPPTDILSANSPSTLGSPMSPLEPMRAVRVAVRLGQGKELSVRLLDEGEAAPAGSQEALLLATHGVGRG